MLKLALITNPNKVKDSFQKKWIEGFESEKNYEKVNTYIQNLMSWYWGEKGTKIKAKTIFEELRYIDLKYGLELDLGKETWNPIIEYMEWFNDENSLSSQWQKYFHKM